MVYKSGEIFLPFCHNPRVWRTDGRTNRQTQTEFSSLYRVCITCSAVKINQQLWSSAGTDVICYKWFWLTHKHTHRQLLTS